MSVVNDFSIASYINKEIQEDKQYIVIARGMQTGRYLLDRL